MTDRERYEMLKGANKGGANLAPCDFDFIYEYEATEAEKYSEIARRREHDSGD